MQADSVPSDQKFSYKWNLSFFKTVPSNRQSFYLGNPLHVVSSLFSHFCLFQNAILHKILKLGFWNFKPICLRMQFSLVTIFFFSSFGYQFELIFASYNQLPDTIYLTLWKPNGLSKQSNGHQVIGRDLSTSPELAVKWIILNWY